MFYQDNVIFQGNRAVRVKYIPIKEEKEINVTLKTLENDITSMTYLGNYPQYREKSFITEKMAIPMFIDSFYDFIYQYGRIPKQKEFWEHYLKTNHGSLTQIGDVVIIDYLSTHEEVNADIYKGKLLRTYPSLLRDFHMWVMLNEDEMFKGNVRYSLWEDRDKVDITITYKGKPYFIGLDVSTKRCDAFREKKQHRHREKDVKYFSINLSEGKMLGHSPNPQKNFIMYPNSTVEEIKEYVLNS